MDIGLFEKKPTMDPLPGPYHWPRTSEVTWSGLLLGLLLNALATSDGDFFKNPLYCVLKNLSEVDKCIFFEVPTHQVSRISTFRIPDRGSFELKAGAILVWYRAAINEVRSGLGSRQLFHVRHTHISLFGSAVTSLGIRGQSWALSKSRVEPETN